jgi:uroporphyrinogen-III synthase
MSKPKILITVSADSCGNLKHLIDQKSDRIMHLPLENYQSAIRKEESDEVKSGIDSFSFAVYGCLRNAVHFMEWVNENELLPEIQEIVHFTIDQPTADFLENHGIPSIMPRENAAPIDILEFMLRISREGKTLYPSVDGKAEEMPALLKELHMEVAEFTVCEETNLDPAVLNEYNQKMDNHPPDAVLFHNRSSITRTKTAFPSLDLMQATVLAGSPGVTKSLADLGIEPDYEAEGTWLSIQNIVEENIL